jgi:single-strand DNA-binding protein
MNNFAGIGRAGRDAVVRHTQAGKAVTGWALAVDTGFGDNKQTTWIDCSAWGDRFTKIAEYIRKGDRVGVVGEIGTREHDGKTYVTLNVRDVTLLGDKRDGATKPAQQSKESAPADDFEEQAIPF